MNLFLQVSVLASSQSMALDDLNHKVQTEVDGILLCVIKHYILQKQSLTMTNIDEAKLLAI